MGEHPKKPVPDDNLGTLKQLLRKKEGSLRGSIMIVGHF
jgi:hypothetical protein